jgi:hypothetical protein
MWLAARAAAMSSNSAAMTRYSVSHDMRVAHVAPSHAPTPLPAQVDDDVPLAQDVIERHSCQPGGKCGGD